MSFEQHCIVELMGHSRIAGKVTEEDIAGQAFLRVDVPETDGLAAFTKFFSANAIYSITPVDEATCLRAVAGFCEKPIEVWQLAPESPLLAEKIIRSGDDRYDDEDWEDDDETPVESETTLPANEQSAIQTATGWLKKDFVVLDTETTGLNNAYPVEVTVIDSNGNALFNQRIKPPDGIEIEPGAAKVHGITAEAVKDCPEWKDVYSDFVAAVKDKTVLIYNASFDTNVIERATTFYKLDPVPFDPDCVMEVYATYIGNWNIYHRSYTWVKLTEAIEREGLSINDAHSALGDCQMTLALVKALAAKSIPIPF